MSRPIRLALLVGCTSLGALHLPAASRALSLGVLSPVSEVRAMERETAQRAPRPAEVGELEEALAQRE